MKTKKFWCHGLELDNLKELNVPYTILKKEGWDDYYIEVKNYETYMHL